MSDDQLLLLCSLLNPLTEQMRLLSLTVIKSFSITTILTFSVPFPPSDSLLACILVKKSYTSVLHLRHYLAIKAVQFDCMRKIPTCFFSVINVIVTFGPLT